MIIILKGSRFLEIADNDSDHDVFIISKKNLGKLMYGANQANTWHLYEVLYQTGGPLYDSGNQFEIIKNEVFNTISIEELFECVAMDLVRYGGIEKIKKNSKRALHYLMLAKIFKNWKETSELLFNYDKNDFVEYRRVSFDEWPIYLQLDYDNFMSFLSNSYENDLSLYRQQRKAKYEQYTTPETIE